MIMYFLFFHDIFCHFTEEDDRGRKISQQLENNKRQQQNCVVLPKKIQQFDNLSENDKFRHIFRQMETLITISTNIESKLGNGAAKTWLCHKCSLEEQDKNAFQLPLKNMVEVANLEKLLAEQNVRHRLVLQLSQHSSKIIKQGVYNILAAVFSNRCGTLLTWTGKGRSKLEAKDSLQSSSPNLVKCIKEAVLSHPSVDKNGADEEIKGSIQEWLKHAKKRLENEQNKVIP